MTAGSLKASTPAGPSLTLRQRRVLFASRVVGFFLAAAVVLIAVVVGIGFLDAAATRRAAGVHEARAFIAKVRACHRHTRPRLSWQQCERRVGGFD